MGVFVSRVARATVPARVVCCTSAVVAVRKVAAALSRLSLRRVRTRAACPSTLASRQRAAAAPCQCQPALPLVVLAAPYAFAAATVTVPVAPASSFLRRVAPFRLLQGRAQLVAVFSYQLALVHLDHLVASILLVRTATLPSRLALRVLHAAVRLTYVLALVFRAALCSCLAALHRFAVVQATRVRAAA